MKVKVCLCLSYCRCFLYVFVVMQEFWILLREFMMCKFAIIVKNWI